MDLENYSVLSKMRHSVPEDVWVYTSFLISCTHSHIHTMHIDVCVYIYVHLWEYNEI